MRTIILLTAFFLGMGYGIAGILEQNVTLPASPPFTYSYWTWGQSPDRQLGSNTVQEIRTLLSKHLRKLPKPYAPPGPGGPLVSPEAVVTILDAKGKEYAQIWLMPGLVLYDGEYATKDKDAVARFKAILASSKPPAGQRRGKKNA